MSGVNDKLKVSSVVKVRLVRDEDQPQNDKKGEDKSAGNGDQG